MFVTLLAEFITTPPSYGSFRSPQKLAEDLYAEGICPADVSSGVLNQAIMELGATYCQTKGTGLDENDPLRHHYLTTKLAGDIWTFLKDGPRGRSAQRHLRPITAAL